MSIHNLNILLPESNKVEDIPVPVPQDPSKIEEPPKSSSEILSELFGAFNAKPPTLTVDIPFVKVKKDPDHEISSDHDIKLNKKHKKHKKHKKGKKRKRSSSRASEISDTEKKSKDVKKRKKSKVNKDDQSSSESNSSKTKKQSHKKRKKAEFSDSESSSSSDNEGSIKKHVHNSKKSKKKKHKKHDENGSDSEEKSKKRSRRNSLDKSETGVGLFKPISIKTEPGLEIRNTVSGENVDMSLNKILNVVIKEKPKDKKKKCINGSKNVKDEISKTIDEVFSSVPLVVSEERKVETILIENIKQEKVTTPPLPVAEAFVEDLVDSGVGKNFVKPLPEKPKTMGGKIKIKNLKFSSVFEETVRQVEEKAKLKAERYEEGELSDSSSEPQRSPSPISSVSVPNSEVEVVVKIPDKAQKKKCRHHHRSRERHRSHSNGRHRSHSDSTKNSTHRDRSKHSKDSKKLDKHTEKSTKSKHRDRSSEKNKDKSLEINKDSTFEKNRDRSSERSRGRSHEKIKDKSYDKNDNRSHDKTRDRSRDKRSRDKSRDRSHDKNDDRLRDKNRHQRHSSSSQRHRSSHSQSKERTQSGSDDRIDKRKLLEIARKNALSMLKAPALGNETAKVTITAGGKTVDELTDFCKLLSKKDADGHESISSDTSHSSDSESEKPFHHPFQIKDRPSNIIMNIRNSVALPVKTMQEKTAEQSRQLRLQFPVSSGQQHRKTEGEWIPVSPKKEEPTQMQVVLTRPTAKPKPITPVSQIPTPSVFQEPPDIDGLDIGSIVSHRLTAMRKLQENPNDCEALSEMYKAQKDMQCWAESKQQPGQFTGSTGVKVLSQAELSSGFQAWARKDQLQVAAPVSSGMGMTLLQKMGWRPGEGLGKNKEGTLQPLLLDIKLDKKGLVAQEELPRRQPAQAPRTAVSKPNLEGKHPVSLLNEYCSRRRHGPPQFDLCFEGGPDHKKHFLVKVKVNGIEYKPALGSPNKKQARAEAALVCLKSLGVLPL